MKNTTGNSIQITIFGESHGEAIGAVIDGLAPGIRLDLDFMHACMEKRRASGQISTKRQEPDRIEFASGYFNGRTTGTPLTILIKNVSQISKDYDKIKDLPRPSHADYAARIKYRGFEDYRGGGHFSGRITAPIVAAGAIFLQILQQKGILIGTHMLRCAGVSDLPFCQEETALRQQLSQVNDMLFSVLDEKAAKQIMEKIVQAQQCGDSVGGILETAVIGMPAGIGEPFFSSVESVLSSLLFSIPAVKGVQFGLGFDFCDLMGSQANDPLCIKENSIRTKTNHNGGLNGGLTNAMPILFRTVIKPTASIYKPQQTVNLASMQPQEHTIHGRHDPCILHRARIVQDCMTAIGLADLLCERFGYLWLAD